MCALAPKTTLGGTGNWRAVAGIRVRGDGGGEALEGHRQDRDGAAGLGVRGRAARRGPHGILRRGRRPSDGDRQEVGGGDPEKAAAPSGVIRPNARPPPRPLRGGLRFAILVFVLFLWNC